MKKLLKGLLVLTLTLSLGLASFSVYAAEDDVGPFTHQE